MICIESVLYHSLHIQNLFDIQVEELDQDYQLEYPSISWEETFQLPKDLLWRCKGNLWD